MKMKVFEKRYFHLCNGGFTISFQEDGGKFFLVFILSSYGVPIKIQIPLSHSMLVRYLRGILEKYEPLIREKEKEESSVFSGYFDKVTDGEEVSDKFHPSV